MAKKYLDYNGLQYFWQKIKSIIPTALSQLSGDSTHRVVTDAEKSTWNGKQDAIPDLATIRSGAALGATALQSVPSEYVTETELNNHHDSTKQDKSTLEQDVADNGFAKIEYVNIPSTSGNFDAETYAILSDTTKEVVVVYNNNYLKRIQVKPEYVRFSMTRNRNVTPGQNETITLIAYNGAPNYSYNFKYEIIDQTYYVIMTTDPELSFAENNLGLNLSAIDMSQLDNSKSEFITLADVDSHHDSTKQDVISDLSTIRSGASKGATAVQPETGKGLFSGDYNDLTNKPTIPSAVTESTVSGWGFTKNTGTYSKPSTGIPKTDLASAVQTSLGKADTALQAHQDISGKQDVISDLSTIRSNASAGASKISCTDAQVGSYGYIKLSDLPIYDGGVS